VAFTILQKFIVLEGLDGAGTTTQMRLLAERLGQQGTPHVETCEPTDGVIGRLLRSILALETHAHPRTVAMLYAADRNEHVKAPQTGIEARTRNGELVICDRYLFSSIAYQSIDCGIDFVLALNSGFPLPRCLIFLDTPVEVCQERLAHRGKPELFDGLGFQSRVREGYMRTLERFRGSGMKIARVDGDRPAGLIHGDLWKVLSDLPINGM
jgi:dTMP kinase